MEIKIEELMEILPRLDERTKQAIYIAVLEERLVATNRLLDMQDKQMAAMRHEVEVLEEAVKMPEGFARTNHSTQHEDEFMNGQLDERQPDFVTLANSALAGTS